MGNLLNNPSPIMQERLAPHRAVRDRLEGRFLGMRDRLLRIDKGRRSARLRGNAAMEGYIAIIEGVAAPVSTHLMLNAWERSNAAAHSYNLRNRRYAADEYWAQRRATAKAAYQRSIDEDKCGAVQACRSREARKQWGTKLPASGSWSGQIGDSTWSPDPGTPAAQAVAETNAGRVAQGKPPLGGVEYKQGHPQFGPYSSVRVRIDNMRGDTSRSYDGDFGQARRAASQKLGSGWDFNVAEQGRTWDHEKNGINLRLVDSRIHSTVYADPITDARVRTGGAVHTGGASMARSRTY